MGRTAPDGDMDRTGRLLPAAVRARARWGVDRVVHAHGREREREDTDLGRALHRHLRHLPVVLLHDRALPRHPAHLAIGPGGVTVVLEAALKGPLTVDRVAGMFGTRHEVLLDGGVDAGEPVEIAEAHVEAVRTLTGATVHVAAAVCPRVVPGAPLLHPLHVGDVLVGGPEAVARLAAREGDLHDLTLAALVDLLDRACPPVA